MNDLELIRRRAVSRCDVFHRDASGASKALQAEIAAEYAAASQTLSTACRLQDLIEVANKNLAKLHRLISATENPKLRDALEAERQALQVKLAAAKKEAEAFCAANTETSNVTKLRA
jgi:hypothetical protein